MQDLKQSFDIKADQDRREIHFSIGGVWSTDEMSEFLRKLGGAAKPLIESPGSFAALGDLSKFVTQQREVAEAIGRSLADAKAHGLNRFAVITDSTLLQMQYKRIAGDLPIAFFGDVASAQRWLRGQA